MALLKEINAARYSSTTSGLVEKFSKNGDDIFRKAYPKIVNSQNTLYYPSTEIISNTVPQDSFTVKWSIKLVDNESYLLQSLFPEGTLNDAGEWEAPKPFKATNSGGEGIFVPDSIDTIEISEPVFNFPLAPNMRQIGETINGRLKTVTLLSTRYEPPDYITEYYTNSIPNFNPSRGIFGNFFDGVFNGVCSATTSTFALPYNKKLKTPRPWEDGASSVTYSQYCDLIPENKEYKSSMDIIFHFKDDKKLDEFYVEIKNYYMVEGYQAFYSVRY